MSTSSKTSKTGSKLLQAFIHGKYSPSPSTSKTPPIILPSAIDPKNVHHHAYHPTTPTQISQAIESTSAAQPIWNSDYSPLQRGKILLDSIPILTSLQRELATLESLDTGRPIYETMLDVDAVLDCIRYFSTLPSSSSGQSVQFSNHTFGYTRREPYGLAVGIGAWNFPLLSFVWKVVPSLVCGNGMVFKPSEYTPSTALRVAEAMGEAGLPDGVLNVVLGDGKVGEALVKDSKVRKVAFTGSTEVGRKIYRSAAEGFKGVSLELGGKSPLLVYEDADLDRAVTGAMMANWYGNGQVCSNGTRVFVHKDVMEEFLELLVERTKRLRLGDPLDGGTQIGPMMNERHLEKVEEYVRIGVEEGATLYYRKSEEEIRRDLPSGCVNGLFTSPVIFTDCRDDMRIVREEIFGMVMTVLEFDDEDEEEVIRRANDSPMGLAAGVFTKDIQRAHRVVHKLEAGVTWINNYNLAPVELPWGGMKASGMGRENGVAALDSWTQWKSVYVEMNEIWDPYSS